MTAKCALAKALLDGRVLNVKNVFTDIGLTNAAREISRMIEQPFQVVVSRTRMEGKSRYGVPVTWTNYKLNFTEYNKQGVQKLRDYVAENSNGGSDFVKHKKVVPQMSEVEKSLFD